MQFFEGLWSNSWKSILINSFFNLWTKPCNSLWKETCKLEDFWETIAGMLVEMLRTFFGEFAGGVHQGIVRINLCRNVFSITWRNWKEFPMELFKKFEKSLIMLEYMEKPCPDSLKLLLEVFFDVTLKNLYEHYIRLNKLWDKS